eukprot:scaffold13240_cov90-Isochrysis_galbana.AAC.1
MERQALCLARTSLGGRIWARQQPETTLRFERGTGLGREFCFPAAAVGGALFRSCSGGMIAAGWGGGFEWDGCATALPRLPARGGGLARAPLA